MAAKRTREAALGRIQAGFVIPTDGVALVDLPGDTTGVALATVQVNENGSVVNGGGSSASVSVTRPNDTTPYSAGDVVGSSTTSSAAMEFTNIAGSAGGDVMITTVTHEVDISSVPAGMTSFSLYFYSSTPPSAYADNAAFDLPSGDRSVFLDTVNIGTPVDLGSTLFVATTQINMQMRLTGSSLFAYLVTNGGYTPSAQSVRKVTVNAVRL